MAAPTIGIHFAARGIENVIGQVRSLRANLNALENTYNRFSKRRIDRAIAGGMDPHSVERLVHSLGRMGKAISVVSTAFSVLSRAVSFVGKIINFTLIGSIAFILALQQLARIVAGVTRAFLQMGMAVERSTESVFQRITMLRVRLGETMGDFAFKAAQEVSLNMASSADEIVDSLTTFLKNPSLIKEIKGSLAEGSQDMVKRIAEFMEIIRLTEPDVMARLGIMLPNILGGSEQSFRAAFETSLKDAEDLIRLRFGALPEGVSAAEFKAGGVGAFRFIEAFKQAELGGSFEGIIGSRSALFSAQLQKLTSSISTLVGTLTGGKTQEGGLATALGRPIRAINAVLTALSQTSAVSQKGTGLNAILQSIFGGLEDEIKQAGQKLLTDLDAGVPLSKASLDFLETALRKTGETLSPFFQAAMEGAFKGFRLLEDNFPAIRVVKDTIFAMLSVLFQVFKLFLTVIHILDKILTHFNIGGFGKEQRQEAAAKIAAEEFEKATPARKKDIAERTFQSYTKYLEPMMNKEAFAQLRQEYQKQIQIYGLGGGVGLLEDFRSRVDAKYRPISRDSYEDIASGEKFSRMEQIAKDERISTLQLALRMSDEEMQSAILSEIVGNVGNILTSPAMQEQVVSFVQDLGKMFEQAASEALGKNSEAVGSSKQASQSPTPWNPIGSPVPVFITNSSDIVNPQKGREMRNRPMLEGD